ncbi:unnamed protein product [Diatraea saccharalis]|uniref:Rhodanese domain-containing protein n=2 Tax=Diatraea saccharalis TaxID=40085 RepID=A0A9N9RFQ9_9NEOP|nr:unnamed protein product [Diatraea saccharalis]
MFYRVLQRTLIPTFRSINDATAVTTTKYVNSSRNVPYNISCHIQYRLFSMKPNPEEMIVSFEEVKNATSNNNVLIVDVREPDEIKEHGKIPNSINIPLGDVTKVLSTMSEEDFRKIYNRSKPSEDSPIIFYCMIGKRSGMAQQNSLNLGYKNVKNYLGSWTEWASKMQS